MVGKSEVLGVRPVVWNTHPGRTVGCELAICHEFAVNIAVVYQIELIHLAPIHCDEGVGSGMPQVMRHVVGHWTQRYILSIRDGAAGSAICSGKGSEIVVEAAILFDDENEVLQNAGVLVIASALDRSRRCRGRILRAGITQREEQHGA